MSQFVLAVLSQLKDSTRVNQKFGLKIVKCKFYVNVLEMSYSTDERNLIAYLFWWIIAELFSDVRSQHFGERLPYGWVFRSGIFITWKKKKEFWWDIFIHSLLNTTSRKANDVSCASTNIHIKQTMTFKPKHEDKTAFLSVYMRTVVFAPITLEASDKKTLLKAKKLQV